MLQIDQRQTKLFGKSGRDLVFFDKAEPEQPFSNASFPRFVLKFDGLIHLIARHKGCLHENRPQFRPGNRPAFLQLESAPFLCQFAFEMLIQTRVAAESVPFKHGGPAAV